MTLKIITPAFTIRLKREVSTFDEANELIKLHAKTDDKCVVFVESSMNKSTFTRIEGTPNIKAPNGRIMSKREVERLKQVV